MDTITITETKKTMKPMKVRTVTITPTTFTCMYTGEQWNEDVKTVTWTSVPLITHAPHSNRYGTSKSANDIIDIIRYGGGGERAVTDSVLRVDYLWINLVRFPDEGILTKDVFRLYYIPKEFENDWKIKMEPYTFASTYNPFLVVANEFPTSFEKSGSYLISPEVAKSLEDSPYNVANM